MPDARRSDASSLVAGHALRCTFLCGLVAQRWMSHYNPIAQVATVVSAQIPVMIASTDWTDRRLQSEALGSKGLQEIAAKEGGNHSQVPGFLQQSRHDGQRLIQVLEQSLARLEKQKSELEQQQSNLSLRKEGLKNEISSVRKTLKQLRGEVSEWGMPFQEATDRRFGLSFIFGGSYVVVLVLGLIVESQKSCRTTYSDELQDNVAIEMDHLIDRSRFVPVCLAYVFITLITCVIVPCYFTASQTSCIAGLILQYHIPFFVVHVIGKMIQLVYYAGITPRRIGFTKYMFKEVTSSLAAGDIYTDFCFLPIAYHCGSHLWVPALIFLLVGVVGMQYVIPIVMILFGGDSATLQRAHARPLIAAKLAHMEVISEVTLADSKDVADDFRPQSTAIAATARCICEDTAQSIIQIIFIGFYGENPLVICSVAIAFLSSIANTFAIGVWAARWS